MVTANTLINSIRAKKDIFKAETPKGEIGFDNIRDDLEKVKHLREGTIQKVPVDNLDIANKKYVDDAVAGGGGGGHVIKDEGGAGLTARSNLNFTGAGVAATDNAVTDSTDVTIPAWEPIGTTATHAALTTGIHGVGVSTVASVANIATHAALTATHGAADIADKSDIAVDANLSAAAQAAIAASHAKQHAINSAADHTGFGDIVTHNSAEYAAAANGVTNGDAHDHVGGDGAQIDHGGLAGLGDDDHTQYTLKATLTEQGDIYYASAAATPAALAHGTAGQVLTSGGHAANPSWAAAAGGESMISGAGTDISEKLFYYGFGRNALDTTKWQTNIGGTGGVAAFAGNFMGGAYGYTGTTNGSVARLNTQGFTLSNEITTKIIEFDIMTSGFAAGAGAVAIGLTTNASSPAGAVVNTCGYGWRLDGTNNNWQFRTADGTTYETDLNVTGLTTATWHRLRFEVSATGGTYKCFLDGTQIGTTHSTNVPVASTSHYNGFSVVNTGEAANRTLYIRKLRVVLIP